MYLYFLNFTKAYNDATRHQRAKTNSSADSVRRNQETREIMFAAPTELLNASTMYNLNALGMILSPQPIVQPVTREQPHRKPTSQRRDIPAIMINSKLINAPSLVKLEFDTTRTTQLGAAGGTIAREGVVQVVS